MHEKLVSLAVLPAPRRVLGVDLMPYSLGNEMQLFREDSPFLTANHAEFNELTLENQCLALIRGVLFCSKAHPRSMWFWNWWLAGYPVRLWPSKREINLGNGANFAVEMASFRNYLADGRLQFNAKLPPSDNDNVRYLGEPEILRLYRFVCAHVPREEIALWGKSAWDFPYSLAKMMSQGAAESAGALTIYNYREKVHDDFHTQCEAGYAAWAAADTDELRAQAIVEHPIIPDLLAIKDEVAAFQNKGQGLCQE
jgi:hypothetical protein